MGNRDTSAVIHKPGKHFGERENGIGSRTSPGAGMKWMIHDPHLDLHGDDPAKRCRDGGNAGVEVAAIRENDDVALQLLLVFFEKLFQMARTDFFLSLDNHFYVNGKLAFGAKK